MIKDDYPLYWIHFKSSLKELFLPYISIPILYILEDIHVENKKEAINTDKESNISHDSTPPHGIRPIIIIGELNGHIDSQKDIDPSGLFITRSIIVRDRIKGIVIGSTI